MMSCNEKLHVTLEKKQLCSCEICLHRLSMNKTATQEHRACAKTWSIIQDVVSCENAEDRQSGLRSISWQAKHDQALLFQPISVCVQEYIHDKKSHLVKLLSLGYESPLPALEIVNTLLEMYSRFKEMVDDLLVFAQEEILPAVKCSTAWLNWSKSVFQNFICSEPALHRALPEILLQLRIGGTYGISSEKCDNALRRFLIFGEEVLTAPVEDRPLHQLINECLSDHPAEADKFKTFCCTLPLHMDVAPSPIHVVSTSSKYNMVAANIQGMVPVVLPSDPAHNSSNFPFPEDPFLSMSFNAQDTRNFGYAVMSRSGMINHDFTIGTKHTDMPVHPPSISSDDSILSLSSDAEEEVEMKLTKHGHYIQNSINAFDNDELSNDSENGTTHFFNAFDANSLASKYCMKPPVFDERAIPNMKQLDADADRQAQENGDTNGFNVGAEGVPNYIKTSGAADFEGHHNYTGATRCDNLTGIPSMSEALYQAEIPLPLSCPTQFGTSYSTQFAFPAPPFMLPIIRPQDMTNANTPVTLLQSSDEQATLSTEAFHGFGTSRGTAVFQQYLPHPDITTNGGDDFTRNGTIPGPLSMDSLPTSCNSHGTPTTDVSSIQNRKKLVPHGKLSRQAQDKQSAKNKDQKSALLKPQTLHNPSSNETNPPDVSGPNQTIPNDVANKCENHHHFQEQNQQTQHRCVHHDSGKGATLEESDKQLSTLPSKPIVETDEYVITPVNHCRAQNTSTNDAIAQTALPAQTCKAPHEHVQTPQATPCSQGNDECKSNSCSDAAANSTGGATKYCDCCYCEFFGNGGPTLAPTSNNYTEMRERLRSKLNKKMRAENKSCKDPPRNKSSECQQALRIKKDLHKCDDRSLEEILSYIEGEAHRIAQPYIAKKTKQKLQKEREKRKKERPEAVTQQQEKEENFQESVQVDGCKNNANKQAVKKDRKKKKKHTNGDNATCMQCQFDDHNANDETDGICQHLPDSKSAPNAKQVRPPESAGMKQAFGKKLEMEDRHQRTMPITDEPGLIAKVQSQKSGKSEENTSLANGKRKSTKTARTHDGAVSLQDGASVDQVFLPKVGRETKDMDDIEKEIDSFKRFCLDSAASLRQKKISVNWKEFSFKKNHFNTS